MKTVFAIILSIVAVTVGYCDTVLSPPVSGNAAGPYPFLADRSGGDSVRYQQVYHASDFTAPGSPLWITELRFTQVSGLSDNTLSNVQIRFSMTSKVPDGLSSIFAENVGASETVVFSGPLRLLGSLGGRYDIRVPLQTAFLFDPLAGNLLMDVKNFSTLSIFGGFRTMTYESTFGDSVSIVLADDVNSASGALATGGLVTLFVVTPIPEPSTILVLSLGLAGIVIVRIRRLLRFGRKGI